MTIKHIGANVVEVCHEDVSILFSYSTPVAAHVAGVGYFKTETKHSVTTSRHISGWLGFAKDRAIVRPQSWFDRIGIDGPSARALANA